MDMLPEFRVTLDRLKPGEEAFSKAEMHDAAVGSRTKLGGKPDWIQEHSSNPPCDECGKEMTFVAQIDSIDCEAPTPISLLSARTDIHHRQWMFSDAGMLYVFFCFGCGRGKTEVDTY